MKRICFLVDSLFSIGGVQRVTAVIAEALSKDNEVSIITFDRPDAQDLTLYHLEDYPIEYRFASYPPIGEKKSRICKAYSYLYRKFPCKTKLTSDLYARSSFPSERRDTLVRLLNDGHYDAIIAVHSFLAIRLATIRKQLGKVKTIAWIHNSFEALVGNGSRYLGPELRFHYGCQLRKLDHVVVLYRQDAELYRQAFGFLPTAIYNPLTLEPGKRSEGTSKRFLAVGRFSPKHKGFDLLIQAFELFAQHNSSWNLDIVGDGPEGPALRNMIAERHLEQRIVLHPFTNHIQQYYSAASIYVLSSRWEGMPLVLVEAMSHGLPIVTSDLPTSLEVLGKFGLYFQNGNIEELARRLEEATQIDWPRKSAEAIAIARRFGVGNIVSQWKNLIEN